MNQRLAAPYGIKNTDWRPSFIHPGADWDRERFVSRTTAEQVEYRVKIEPGTIQNPLIFWQSLRTFGEKIR